MEAISELKEILNGFIKCNKYHTTCLAKILISMCIVKTVNLSEIACAMYGDAKQESRYRQLQRFFQKMIFDYDAIAHWIVKWFFVNGPWYLALDRTNWRWGKQDINILVLAIVHEGIAIPVYFMVLNKRGSTSTRERNALVTRFANVFGKENIAGILADREFTGKEWFRYLVWKELNFFIRIKDNALVANKRGKNVNAKNLFYGLKRGEKRSIKGKRCIYGRDLYITGARSLASGELMVVVSNCEVENAVEIYLKRWQIETLFGCLKSRGFRFEETHITDRAKIKKMMVLLTIEFCWSYKAGEWRHTKEKAILLKAHHRRAVSIFRYGLDFLREAILKMGKKSKLIRICLKLFLCLPCPSKPTTAMAYGGII